MYHSMSLHNQFIIRLEEKTIHCIKNKQEVELRHLAYIKLIISIQLKVWEYKHKSDDILLLLLFFFASVLMKHWLPFSPFFLLLTVPERKPHLQETREREKKQQIET